MLTEESTMNRLGPKATVILLLVLSIFRSAAQEAAPQTIRPLHVEGNGIEEVLRNIANVSGVLIGVETTVAFGKEEHLVFNFRGGSIADLAQASASLIPGGKWRVSGERSIVLWDSGFATTVAHTSVAFGGIDHGTRQAVWTALLDNSDLNNLIASKGCRRLDQIFGKEWSGDKPAISITAGNHTVEDILLQSASMSGRSYWAIYQNHRQGQCEIIIELW